MRLTLIGSIAADGVAAAFATPADAGDCVTMRANNDEAQVLECRAAVNEATQGESRAQCFLSAEDGFAWVGRETGHAEGRIAVASCTNQGKTMTLNEFLESQ